MTPIKRPLAAAGAAVLLTLSLSACGGAPTDASVKDFCKVTQDEEGGEEFFKAIEDKDWDKVEELVKKQADEVEEVGTPEDIPDDAREGYEIQLDTIRSFSADDWEKAFKEGGDDDFFEKDLSSDEKKKVDAYTEYENKTCDDDSGSDSGSDESEDSEPSTDLPTEDLPTDIPTDGIPTDVPTDLSPEDLESLQSELEKLTESAATE